MELMKEDINTLIINNNRLNIAISTLEANALMRIKQLEKELEEN
jgi:hypothetical protein